MEFDARYYASQYRDYRRQNPPRKMAFYRNLAESVTRGVVRPRVLDFGCAFGLFLESLGDRWDRTGIDVSAHAIADAAAARPGICFRTMAAGAYPDAGLFDVITAFDVLEHIEPLDEAVAWIVRSLVPGGVLIAVVPVYDGPTGPLVRILDRDPTHVHRCPRDFWLRRIGAVMTVQQWNGIVRYLLPGGAYVHLTTKRWRRFTPAIALVARKEG